MSTWRNEPRSTALLAAARQAFGAAPAYLVRAPGRVNLIGEHTDYNGLPVMPMAVDRDVRIAVTPRSDATVRLANVAAFGPRTFELSDTIPPFDSGDWGNYVKAAAQGMVQHARLRSGADLLVDGNVPAGAGLSSSSALVVASSLALLAANQVEIPHTTLAELLPQAERYVGTMSGGMDQTISLLGRAGHALRIDFFPVRFRPVPLPAEYSWLVCHSLVHAEKSGGARDAYNRRVLECQLGCLLLELSLPQATKLQRLGDLPRNGHTVRAEEPEGRLEAKATWASRRGLRPLLSPNGSFSPLTLHPLAGYAAVLASRLEDRPASIEEIAAAFAPGDRDLLQRLTQLADAAGVCGPYAPVRRVRHVLGEADRVEQAEVALRAGDVATFGALMNDSHRSCRDDYEISCAELEELVTIARHHGALGARLTGAGFGGCTVNLVAEQDLAQLIDSLDRHFYAPRSIPEEQLPQCRFALEPAAGAEVIRL
ncbi:MAG TPA: galactokinase [Terriglobales bacterium]|nr:galactokinase [Terriglobales bacterium]